MEKLPKIALPLIIGFIVLVVLLSKSALTIDSGQAGVLYRTFDDGVVTDEPPLGEGFHIIAPWNKVFIYEVRQQEVFEKMSALSSNGLDIKLDASIWFQPDFNNLGKLHQEKSKQYKERVLLPAIRSAARSVVGRYTPEQLYSSKRDAIQKEIFEETKKFPKEEKYSLTDQIRRSSRSTAANIAESYAKRRYPKHFISKLTDSDAENLETQTWLEFANECSYLESDRFEALIEQTVEIAKLIHYMIHNPGKFGSK